MPLCKWYGKATILSDKRRLDKNLPAIYIFFIFGVLNLATFNTDAVNIIAEMIQHCRILSVEIERGRCKGYIFVVELGNQSDGVPMCDVLHGIRVLMGWKSFQLRQKLFCSQQATQEIFSTVIIHQIFVNCGFGGIACRASISQASKIRGRNEC